MLLGTFCSCKTNQKVLLARCRGVEIISQGLYLIDIHYIYICYKWVICWMLWMLIENMHKLDIRRDVYLTKKRRNFNGNTRSDSF